MSLNLFTDIFAFWMTYFRTATRKQDIWVNFSNFTYIKQGLCSKTVMLINKHFNNSTRFDEI